MIPAWPPSEHQLLQQGFQSLQIWSGDAAFYDAQLCMTKSRIEKESKNELLTYFYMTAKIEKENRVLNPHKAQKSKIFRTFNVTTVARMCFDKKYREPEVDLRAGSLITRQNWNLQ